MHRPTFTFEDAAGIVTPINGPDLHGFAVKTSTEAGRKIMADFLAAMPRPPKYPPLPQYDTLEEVCAAADAAFRRATAKPVSEAEASRVISIQRGIDARKAGAK